MSTKPKKTPRYRIHKATGQGYVVLNGRAIYLGRCDKPESQQRYHQVIAAWLAAGRQLRADPQTLTVKELIARYWKHAEDYYVKPDGQPTSQLGVLRGVLRPLRDLFGETQAADFSPLALKAVRQRMVNRGWSRTTINQAVSRIKQVFRWAVENELIPGHVHHSLQAVAGLRRGRCEARESEPVRPVPAAYVEAVRPFVSRQVWAMIELQRLTAARPGETVLLRPCDLDTSGRVWTYTLPDHKTAHHGHRRVIYLGPRVQAVLRPFLARPTTSYVFSPVEAEAERREHLHRQRKTPLSYGNRPGTNRRERPERSPRDRYTVASYRRAIAYACDRAFPPPAPLARREGELGKEWKARLTADQRNELAAWRRDHRWHPHQLRHNAATELRKEFGLDAARIILGHRSPAITEVYAELDRAKALEIMAQVG